MIKHSLRMALALISIPISAYAADSHVGQVVSVSGKVLVRLEAAKTMQMTFLKPGDKLAKGSIVNTGANGSAKLLMTDKTIIDLAPSTLFKVNEYDLRGTSDRKVDLSVDQGTIRASVNEKVNPEKGKFTIRTKAATMGVRGTEFVVNTGGAGNSGNGAMSITVIKGQVEVTDLKGNAGAMKVDGGNQFMKQGSNAAVVTRLDSQKLTQVRSEAFQKDMTFLQSVVIDASTTQSQANDAPAGDRPPENRDAPVEGEKTADGTAPATDGTPTEARPTDGTVALDAPKPGEAPSSPTGDAPPPPPPPSGNLAMAGIVANVNLTTTAMVPMKTTELRLPGMMPPPLLPPQGVQIIQGLPKNLNVIFTP